MPNQFTFRPLAEAVWTRYEVVGECWEWTGKRDRHGYGRLNHEHRTVFAHRAAYELSYGPIPPGKHVCHHCDNPPCLRPSHLFLGSQTENLADMTAKGRRIHGDRTALRLYPHLIRRGEHAVGAKLTADAVRAIRERYAAGGVTQDALAAEYGVGSRAISKIVSRQRWRHI